MSRIKRLFNSKGKRITVGIAAAVMAALFVGLSLTPTTGADFSHEVENDFTIEAGDADFSTVNGSIDIVLAGTGTDDMQSDTVNVTVGGTVPLNLSVCDLSIDTMSDVAGEEDELQLRVRANGVTKQAWDSATDVMADGPVALGKYYPGNEVGVEFGLYLRSTATDAWELAEIVGDYTLCGDEAQS